jgi:hypothetical protein
LLTGGVHSSSPPPAVSTSDSTAPPKSTLCTRLPRRGPHAKYCPALFKAPPPPVSPQPNPRSHPSSCAPPPANPSCRRALFSSPLHPDRRGAVQELREIKSKPLVPRVRRRSLYRWDAVARASSPPPTTPSSRELSSSLVSRPCYPSRVRYTALYILVKSARCIKHPSSVWPRAGEPAAVRRPALHLCARRCPWPSDLDRVDQICSDSS